MTPACSAISAWSFAGAARAHPSAEVNLLDFRALITAPSDTLEGLRAVFPSVPHRAHSPGPVMAWFSVERDAEVPSRHQIRRDGFCLHELDHVDDILPYLAWELNLAAIESLGQRYLLFHAGAVASRGQGFLLPAASGSGKTTLVAGLVAAGFEYFSDEVGVLDPGVPWHLLPYAKSLYVKKGSLGVVADLVASGLDAFPHTRLGGEAVWLLPPPARSWASMPAQLKYVIFPQYVPAAATVLEPLPRMSALTLLLEQSFSVQRQGGVGLERSVDLLRRADCYRLIVGDLQSAVETLQALAAA
jgi:hypothetical protein